MYHVLCFIIHNYNKTKTPVVHVDWRRAKSVSLLCLLPQRRAMGVFIRIYILFCLILTYDFYAAISQSEAVFDAGSIFSMNIP